MILQDYTPNNTFSPIENIENSRMGLEQISTHLTNIMLKNFTSLEENDITDLKHYLQYLFLELMNNVADHAHSPVGGYTMAQYYPKEKKIQFTVSDRGVAFLENIQLNFSDIKNEEEAIFKALKKGVTSTKQLMYNQPKNAGFGLYAMFEILKMTGGRFVIISNDTLIRYENEKYTTSRLQTPWKGVVVAFEFFEININYTMDEFNRNFLWKLDEEDDDFF
jgi:anti-sigma regulatory factor (Ser/Thr protein kinase)